MPKEIQKKVFDLTLAVYRVTDFFPQIDPLRKHIREKANDVFGMSSEYSFSLAGEREAVAILAKIESLKGYLSIARSLRFVKPINLTILEREYDFIAKFFSKELNKREDLYTRQSFDEQNLGGLAWDEFTKRQEESKMMSDMKVGVSDKKEPKSHVKHSVSNTSDSVNDRQQKILEYIRQTSQAKISDFFTSFADISSKTIQRDLQDLVAKNILKKEGEKRWTIYSLAE